MSAASELIYEFCAAWSDMDLDGLMDFFAEDALYVNAPLKPIHRGKAEIREVIGEFLDMMDKVEVSVLRQIDDGRGLVMNERVDRFQCGGRVAEAPCVGVYEIRDGKIAAWREYFDLETFARAFKD